MAKQYGRPVEAGKGKEMDTPQEGTEPCWQTVFSTMRPISDFWTEEPEEGKFELRC